MKTVDAWIEALRSSGVDLDDIEGRCKLLAEFSGFCESTPDELVESCVDRDGGRIVPRRRKEIEARIDEFAHAEGTANREATERANVIRSFFIHNGVRLLAPKAPWL